MYIYIRMYIRMYIYIYTNTYTRVLPCASAHRERRWIWSEVATILSGTDPTVLSQTLSQIRSQNTITNSITTSIAHYLNLRALAEWELS